MNVFKKYTCILAIVTLFILTFFCFHAVLVRSYLENKAVFFKWEKEQSPPLGDIVKVFQKAGFKIVFYDENLKDRLPSIRYRHCQYDGDYIIGYLLDDIVIEYDVSYKIKIPNIMVFIENKRDSGIVDKGQQLSFE